MDTLDHALSAQTREAWQGWAWGELEASPLCAPPLCGKGRLQTPANVPEQASDLVFHFPNPEALDREPRRPRRGSLVGSATGGLWERLGGREEGRW